MLRKEGFEQISVQGKDKTWKILFMTTLCSPFYQEKSFVFPLLIAQNFVFRPQIHKNFPCGNEWYFPELDFWHLFG